VLVVGNTVEGEEERLLEVWAAARRRFPGLRLILAPRQPRRFEIVASLISAQGIAFQRASLPWVDEEAWQAQDALLLDTLGELSSAYAEGTAALVAGGWAASGGHNPLEPVRAGLPTLIGPGFANFEDLVAPLVAAGLVEVVDLAELETSLLATLARAPLRPESATLLPESLAGALDRTWAQIAPWLPL
jgi:3-deoxy-D-manno-octulosonic-acid transferase